MKPILYIALAGSFALGACSSTYKTAQTPDDVYYSPRQQQRTYASNNGSNGNSVQDENGRYTDAPDDGGTYVTYDDDQGDYQRRINRFGSNANTYNGGYWDGYNAASNLYMGSGFGYGYGPYSSFGYSSLWGPSISMGFGWGYGGFYRPWSYGLGFGWGGYPYVGSYWPYYGGYYGGYYGHYYPYYAGGYYGGGHYGGGYYTRPANSYGPVRNNNERISRTNYTNNSGGNAGGGGYYRPSRGATAPVSGGGNGNYVPSNTDRPRRIFQQSSSERPVISRPSYDNGGGNYNNNGGNYSRPSRVEYSRPSAPSPAPSYSAPSGGGRSNTGGGGGGGGYSRPSRGGR